MSCRVQSNGRLTVPLTRQAVPFRSLTNQWGAALPGQRPAVDVNWGAYAAEP